MTFATSRLLAAIKSGPLRLLAGLLAVLLVVLACSAAPGLADQFDTAQVVDLPAADSVSVTVTLAAGESYMYQFTAPANGTVRVSMQADSGDLDPMLESYDARRRRRGRNDNASRDTLDSLLTVRVRDRELWYVLAAGADDTAGECTITFTSVPRDDCGNTFDTAKGLRLRRGLARGMGRLDYNGDVDVFSVVTVNAAPLTVELTGSGRRSQFSGTVGLYDSLGQEVTCQATDNGLFKDAVGAGETYYIEVRGTYADQARDNRYRLNVYIPEDKQPNTIADAQTLRLRRGRGRVRASIDFDWDQDVFAVVASSTSPMTVNLVPSGRRSAFDGQLVVYAADGAELASADDPQSGGASLAVDTVAGRSYYIKVAGVAGSTGSYQLSVFSPLDDHGNTMGTASAVRLRRNRATVRGNFEFAGDVDVLRVTAPVTGQMRTTFTGGRRSGIAPELTVYNAQGGQIGNNGGNGAAGQADLTVDVEVDKDYYIEVKDEAGLAIGRYTVTIGFEAGPISIGLSAAVVAVDNSAVLTGYVSQDIVVDTDTDWLSAQMVVTLTAGTIYQDASGGNTSPNPAMFATVPTLAFDSYVSNGVVGESVNTLSAADLNPSAPLQFDDSGISIGWFTMVDDDIGTLPLARVTLSDDAEGTWRFKATASPAGTKQVDMSGTISNGVMTPD